MSRRPSDAALAAAFWEARKRMADTPPHLIDAKEKQFGDAIVVRARELQRLHALVNGKDMAHVWDDSAQQQADGKGMNGGGA